jgi:hypothetical protein
MRLAHMASLRCRVAAKRMHKDPLKTISGGALPASLGTRLSGGAATAGGVSCGGLCTASAVESYGPGEMLSKPATFEFDDQMYPENRAGRFLRDLQL